MTAPSEHVLALRRGTLAVSVLDDIALTPRADGVALGEPGVDSTASGQPVDSLARPTVTWSELAVAVGEADPEGDSGRARLRAWLRLRLAAVEAGPLIRLRAEQAAVPAGLPVDHVLHPGPGWVREHVLGGVLDLGIGLRGMFEDPDEVTLLPDLLAAAIGVDTSDWWPALRLRLEGMGELTVARLRRDGIGLMGPMGGCDVVTLLGARSLRRHLARDDGTGMRAVAVPMRTRGWFDLARIDPAFVGAAHAATEETERGFGRPVLVTEDEIGLAKPGGNVIDLALRDPAVPAAAWRH